MLRLATRVLMYPAVQPLFVAGKVWIVQAPVDNRIYMGSLRSPAFEAIPNSFVFLFRDKLISPLSGKYQDHARRS